VDRRWPVFGDVPNQDQRNVVGLGGRGERGRNARTCVTPPATPSTWVVDMVCTESTMTSDGLTVAM